VGNNAIACTTTNGWCNDCLFGQPYTLPAMTVTSIGVQIVAGSAAEVGFLALYADNGSGAPGTLVATTGQVTINAGTNTVALTTNPLIAAGTYWIMGDTATVFYVCKDGTTENADYDPGFPSTSAPPATFPAATVLSDEQQAFWVIGH
jgi:hypothetical protein